MNKEQYMKPMIYLSVVLLIISCNNLRIDKKSNSSNLSETKINQELADSFPIELKLDTSSQFQNKQIEPDDSLFFENKIYLIHVNQGSEIGYILYKVQNNFHVALIEWNDCYKVIGITGVEGLRGEEEYAELLYSDTPINSIIFGIIKKENSNIKTVKAYQINNSKKKLEEIDPSKIDFTMTYDTEI